MNFLDPTFSARCASLLRRIPALWIFASVALLALATVELMRLHAAAFHAAASEARRDAAVAHLAAIERRGTALHERMRLLQNALEIRRSGARRAAAIAAIGNALPEMVALTALRDAGSSWQLEGRGPYLEAVQTALARLHMAGAPSQIIAVRRDPRGQVVSFELELASR